MNHILKWILSCINTSSKSLHTAWTRNLVTHVTTGSNGTCPPQAHELEHFISSRCCCLEGYGNFRRWALEGGSGSLEHWPWVFPASCFLFWCEERKNPWCILLRSWWIGNQNKSFLPSAALLRCLVTVMRKGTNTSDIRPLLSKSSYTVPVFRCDHPLSLNSVWSYFLAMKTIVLPYNTTFLLSGIV